MGLYDVPLSMMGTMLVNFPVCGIMLLLSVF